MCRHGDCGCCCRKLWTVVGYLLSLPNFYDYLGTYFAAVAITGTVFTDIERITAGAYRSSYSF